MRQQAEKKLVHLGFVNGDFIYGKMKSEDAGKKASGESITPMYELEIRNSKNKKVASYSFVDKGIYISDILIDDNMVTLNRVEKAGIFTTLLHRSLLRIMRNAKIQRLK